MFNSLGHILTGPQHYHLRESHPHNIVFSLTGVINGVKVERIIKENDSS